VVIDVPDKAPDPIDTVIVLDVPAKVEVAAGRITAAKDGSYTFLARDAETHGGTVRFEADKNCIGFWTDAKDWVSWPFQAAAGTYRVEITCACEAGSGGSTVVVAAGGPGVEAAVKETGSWTKFTAVRSGTLTIEKAGPAELTVKPKSKPALAVMNLRSIRLVPMK